MSINHRWRNDSHRDMNSYDIDWHSKIADESYVLRTFHHRTSWSELPLSLIEDHPSHVKLDSESDNSDDSDCMEHTTTTNPMIDDQKEKKNESESESKQSPNDDANNDSSKQTTTERSTATKTIPLNAEQHAFLDFSGDSVAQKRMIEKWRCELNSFSLRNSSFGCIFDKRYNVLKSLFRHFEKHSHAAHYDPYYQMTHNKYKKHSKPDFSTVKVPMKIWHQIPGTDPSLWPNGLDEFIAEITSLRELSLYEERHSILNQFFIHALKRIESENDLKLKGKMICALLAFVIRNGSAVFTLQIMKVLQQYQAQLDEAPKDIQTQLLPLQVPSPVDPIANGNDNANDEDIKPLFPSFGVEYEPSPTSESPFVSPSKQSIEGGEVHDNHMFGWMHCRVRTMLNELNIRLNDYQVTVPRLGSRTIAVQITESARKATEAEHQLLIEKNNKKNKKKSKKSNKSKSKARDLLSELDYQRHAHHHYYHHHNNPYRNARISHGKGFTTDGRFLYVHCSRGLIKIGTGDQNTRKWEFYGCRSYRNGENVQLVWVDGKLYARSTQMKFGVVEVIDCNTLELQYQIYLGIDCNTSVPQQWKAKDLPMITDGLYLYLVTCESDWKQYHDKVTEHKIKMEEERKRIQEEKKKKQKQKQKLRKERKLGVTTELLQKYKRQHKEKEKQKSNKPELPPNDKQTQTDPQDTTQCANKETQTQGLSSHEVAMGIVSDLIRNATQPKDIDTQHIRSVQSIKRIIGIQDVVRDKKKKKKTRKKSKKKELSGLRHLRKRAKEEEKNKKHKRSSRVSSKHKEEHERKASSDEKSIAAKIGPPTKKLCLYAFEVAKAAIIPITDMKTSEPRLRQSLDNEKLIQKRKATANRLHHKYFERRFTPQTWYRALTVKADDEATAKRWVEEHGAHSQQIKYAPLVRHLVLENPTEHDSTDAMFSNCMFYCSGHQFVILVPPHTNPWSQNSDKWLGRVYRLRDGAFIQDTKDISLKYQATRACVDPLNNLIWFGYLQNDLIFQSYKNHGPAACFYEIADDADDELDDAELEDQQKEKEKEPESPPKQVDDQAKELQQNEREEQKEKGKEKQEPDAEQPPKQKEKEKQEPDAEQPPKQKEKEKQEPDAEQPPKQAPEPKPEQAPPKLEQTQAAQVQKLEPEQAQDTKAEEAPEPKTEPPAQQPEAEEVSHPKPEQVQEPKSEEAPKPEEVQEEQDPSNLIIAEDTVVVQQLKNIAHSHKSLESTEAKEEPKKLVYKWQWQNDGPQWMDYDKEINDTIEENRTAKEQHQFVVGDKIYEIRFNSLTQCNLATGFERPVRRVVLDGNQIEEKAKETDKQKEKEMRLVTVHEWQWETPNGWELYEDAVHAILNELPIGETASLQLGQWNYEITKVNEKEAMQRNKRTQKVRNARRMTKEIKEEVTKQTRATQQILAMNDEEILKTIDEYYHKEIIEAKAVLDAAIFDGDVYSFIPNSPEHILQSFSPQRVLHPVDVSMFLCATMNRLLRHCSDSTPLPPINHAIYYAKKKRRKEINEEIEKLKKSRASNEEEKETTETKKKQKQESEQERKKRKHAKECADKFFKIFDVAHNGDLDFNEFKKGCETVKIKWQSLFVEVQKQRQEAKRKLEEEKVKKKKQKMQKFHAEIQAQRNRLKKFKKQKKKSKDKTEQKEQKEQKDGKEEKTDQINAQETDKNKTNESTNTKPQEANDSTKSKPESSLKTEPQPSQPTKVKSEETTEPKKESETEPKTEPQTEPKTEPQ
eukprot:81171_1